jgi:hypothetical protein
MIVVPNLPSSIINREIDEIKHRHVPLTYRRFAPPFKKPTDTSLLQALVLASTGHSNRIPDVVDTKNQSIFAQTINDFQGAHPQQTDINRSEVVPPTDTPQQHQQAEDVREDDVEEVPEETMEKGGERTKRREKSPTNVSDFDFGRRRRRTPGDTRRRHNVKQKFEEHQARVRNTINGGHIPSTRKIGPGAININIEHLHKLRSSANVEKQKATEHLDQLLTREATSTIRPSDITDHEKTKVRLMAQKKEVTNVVSDIDHDIKEMMKTLHDAHPISMKSKIEKKKKSVLRKKKGRQDL